MEKILIVEDDSKISETLRDFMTHADFSVIVEARGDVAYAVFKTEKPDLVILDLNLPGKDGIAVCQQIRETSAVPIIMLTARREEIDQVKGLEVGADDYIIKPFSPKVLVLKVQRMLERPPLEDPDMVRLQDLEIDVRGRTVLRLGTQIEITPVEFNLLLTLFRTPLKAFSRDQLLDLIYDDVIPPDIFDRTIDSHIKNMRKKLLPGDYIQTVRGIGYQAIADRRK